jgi:flagellin-like hook-associated protein FlgL
MPFYRTNKYTYDKNYYYNTYELIDPVGKTTEEMGVSYNDISGKILNYLDLNTVSSNPDKKYNYQTTYSNWNKTETGTKVSDTYANDQYTVNVDLPGLTNYDSAANISVRLKASELVAMTNGEQQSANLLFQATGKAQRTLLPIQSSHHLTSERDFTQIKLNVPKKRLDIQAGAEAGQHIRMEWDALNLTLIGMGATNTRTVESSQRAIVETKNALNIISENRSTFGAYQNRMEHAIRMTDNVVENTTYSESQIRDTDMSKAMMELAKDNILEQAGVTILAQANQSRQGILNLLQ